VITPISGGSLEELARAPAREGSTGTATATSLLVLLAVTP
jgi:hypothetical protein